MAKATRPCPFCGEEIKTNAVKCRFCGEFLEDEEEEEEEQAAGDDEGDDEEDDEEEDDGGGMKWVAPVGRSAFAILAGYFGILALVPVSLILYSFFGKEDKPKPTIEVMQIGNYINIAVGGMAVLLGIVAIVMVFTSKKGGLGRAIFAILAGIAGPIAWWMFINLMLIPLAIDPNQKKLDPKLQEQIDKLHMQEKEKSGN